MNTAPQPLSEEAPSSEGSVAVLKALVRFWQRRYEIDIAERDATISTDRAQIAALTAERDQARAEGAARLNSLALAEYWLANAYPQDAYNVLKNAVVANADRILTDSTPLKAFLTRHREMEAALAESVKLQSHYADLLNMYDGGKRMTFANADEWIARMALLKGTQQS